MSLIDVLVQAIIGLGASLDSLGGDIYFGGPKFKLSYVPGHPEFRPPDEKGHLVVARDRLRCASGSNEVVFEIPMGHVASARPVDPDILEIHVIDAHNVTADIYFRSRQPTEIQRFLQALTKRLPGVILSD